MESRNRLQHIINCLVEFRKLWLIPAILGLAMATIYSFFIKTDMWTARQTMIIRDDLSGDNLKPGTFISEEAMKSAQETVLETSRRPEVIRQVLTDLGPDTSGLFGGSGSPNWPTDETVEDFRDAVSFGSANGGEAGQSAVIVLSAKATSKKRALGFLTLLLAETDKKLSEIRANRFESMEAELRATCDSALRSRETLERKVTDMETALGEDISLVRSLNENSSGGSPSAFEVKLNEIHLQKREASRDLSNLESAKRSLIAAQRSSLEELPTSAELLNGQPALANLVVSLAQAKQNLSEAEGLYRSAHPTHRAAVEQVASIKKQIQRSINTVVHGIDGQLEATRDRLALLNADLDKNTETLKRVSKNRVPYAMATKELNKQTEDYSKAGAKLASMRSRKIASASIKLLNRVGDPWIGTRPDGIGKRVLSLIGGLAGLLIGLGLVMIVAPGFDENPAGGGGNYQGHNQPEPSQELGSYLPKDRYQQQPPPRQPVAERQPAPTPPREPVAPRQPAAPVAETKPAAPVVKPEPVPVPTAESVVSQKKSSIEQASEVSSGLPAMAMGAAGAIGAGAIGSKMIGSVTESFSATMGSVTDLAKPGSEESAAPEAETPGVETEVVDNSTPVATSENQYSSQAGPQLPVSEPEAPAKPTVEVTAPVAQQTATEDSSVTSTSAKLPPSKTLAAIFANMPQPRTDIDVDSSSLTDETPEPRPREDSRTIQLDNETISSADGIPLQRRTTFRPVDLAKEAAEAEAEKLSETTQDSIDSVFSKLKPKS